MSSIEGIPEGWELVRVGHPVLGVDTFLGDDGTIVFCSFNSARMNCVIIRKIEKPKQYRAFANAAEFKPHFDRPVCVWGGESWLRVLSCSEKGVKTNALNCDYETAFEQLTFADGSPFGVEVTE